ncbi:MAG: phosphoribosylamine--glycine ligase [Myxococcota bacterium]
MRALVLGSGGREHALVWALARSPLIDQVLCAPGSDAIAWHGRCVKGDPEDAGSLLELVKRERVRLVVVGPEAPLVAGIADRLSDAGVAVFGPSAAAARLEGSKSFAKAFMERHGVPTAAYRAFQDPDRAEGYVRERGGTVVVKADGLAAGKGVYLCADPDEATAALSEIMRDRRFGDSGASVVIEDWLMGEEASYYAICDGERTVCLAAAQDHKRVFDEDRGENTGGMGAYSPAPVVSAEVEKKVIDRIVRPTLDGMRAEGSPYRGVLYVGLMIADGEPSVVEFNVRFGDPETQALLYRLESDLVPLLLSAAQGRLPEDDPGLVFGDPAVCVVLASEGYPRSYPTGREITGLDEVAARQDVIVFHSGTRQIDGRWETAGGRVLGVTARGPGIAAARDRAYAAARRIRFEGAHFRSDIALRALRDHNA